MSAADEARAETEREALVEILRGARNPDGRVVLRYESAADAILAAGYRKAEITDEMVERMARTLFARTTEAGRGWTWPINGDWGRQRDLKDARKALRRVLGFTPVEQTEQRAAR